MDLNRRAFLFGSAAATALAGCSTCKIGPRSLAEGERRRIAMIGCGIQMRTALIPQFLNSEYAGNVEIVAVCDCDRVRAAAGAKLVNDACRSQKCVAVYDFRKVLEDPMIDAVCIATPDHWHAYMAVEAMKHGKDVYCESPMTFSVDEAKKVMEAQEKYDRVLQTGLTLRSRREFRVAVGLVRGGLIGDVMYVDANYGGGAQRLGGPSQPTRFFDKPENAATEGAPNGDVDWDLWLGPAAWRPYSDQLAPRGVHGFYPMFWRFDDDLGSGSSGVWGVHHLDIAQWGLEMDASGPYRVLPSEEPYSTNRLHGGRRPFGMKMLFAKEYGTVELYHGPSGVWGTVFYGTKGIVAVNRGKIAVWVGGRAENVKPDAAVRQALQDANDRFAKECLVVASVGKDGAAARTDEGLETVLDGVERDYAEVLAAAGLPFSPNQVQNFCECLESRDCPISSAEVGGRAAALGLLCNAAYKYDCGFDWDPVNMEVAGCNREGISFRREVYRAGWDVEV